jgi:Ca2+-binding EF-hand superfamily protein
MKLAALALVTTLGLGGAAHADPGRPEPGRPRDQLQQLLLERFDRNHDGQLEPQERRRAIRALRRLARRLALQDRRADGQDLRQRALVRRFDANGDGVVSPEELPPGVARKLRRRDRDADGRLDDRDPQ